jgi:uncharacterized protein (TIGR02270 family)
MGATRDMVRWDIVEEHLGEAEFLFDALLAAQESSTTTQDDTIAAVEDRLVAHLDALAVGGEPVAHGLLWPALAPDAKALTWVAAAATALLAAGGPHAIDRMIALLVESVPGPLRDGLATALAMSPRADVASRVLTAAESGDDVARRALLPIVAWRGGAPGRACVEWIRRGLSDPEPGVRATAVGLADHCGRQVALAASEHALADPDPGVATRAMHVALVHGSTHGHTFAVELASARRKGDPALVKAAMTAVALGGERQAVDLLLAATSDETRKPFAIRALGFCGRLDAIDPLLALAADEKTAKLAGEALVGIMGLGRDDRGFWLDEPPAPEVTDADIAGPLPAEDLDVDPAPGGDDELPVPFVPAFAEAWARGRSKLDPTQRYAEGYPLVDTRVYAFALAHTTMRRRPVLALELAIRTRGELRVPVRSFFAQQRPLLAVLDDPRTLDGARPYARIS